MKKIGAGIIILLPVGLIAWYSGIFRAPADQSHQTSAPTRFTQRTVMPTPIPTPTPQTPSKLVIQTVPFVAQAPFGNWADPRQQDGCEEASVLMAAHWLKGTKTLSQQQSLNELLQLSAFGEQNYGTYHDTSIRDTARFFEDYYNHDAVEILSDADIDTILDNLQAGHLVIAPTNGRLLQNPNFTAPGPEYHMLVIIGFDSVKKEFITNDPGTRQGTSYRYPYQRLYEAIADYDTGQHIPRSGIEKTILVVQKR